MTKWRNYIVGPTCCITAFNCLFTWRWLRTGTIPQSAFWPKTWTGKAWFFFFIRLNSPHNLKLGITEKWDKISHVTTRLSPHNPRFLPLYQGINSFSNIKNHRVITDPIVWDSGLWRGSVDHTVCGNTATREIVRTARPWGNWWG